MADLVTVPTFTFNQGNLWNGDSNAERPISVEFYNGSIVLEQQGEYDIPERINILPEFLDKLFKEIKKHKPEAEKLLKR